MSAVGLGFLWRVLLFVADNQHYFIHTQSHAGYTTFDVAPFYGQVERWLGEVRAKIEDPLEREAYRIFTKLAFPPLLPTDRIGRAEVEREVDACLARLRASRLDLLQLHWWDFDDPRYLDVLHYLSEFKEKGARAPRLHAA